ncbi:DUF3784 domain-containing protein [Cytobacillus dafuensis]|uniref:DUF3784 domain-containing protein n=1 Tax=Cytobacillus dafuensis TaxID=1742359 RepID=A0A5B8Z9B2_CYTDA|nr:DUF3784 domain-containing protein [Cytobacillus dafuensis]QED49558.1 DUF3784 domain-containing protein [Cytobacillus dafuensis]
MNQHFIIISLILFILAYLVGVKKQTWLLSGFNQKRVKDQDKLAKLVGSYNFVMAIVILGGAFIDHPDTQVLIPILIIGYVILLGYVNTKMVE